MANKNFIVKNGLEVGGQEVVSSSGVVTSAALGGQTLASTDSPTFNNLTLTNDIAVGGDINLTGDLNITGDVNTLSVTDLDVTDQTITLGKGQVESASGGSGIVIDGSGASILWDETNDEWDFNKKIKVIGDIVTSQTIYSTGAITSVSSITANSGGNTIVLSTDGAIEITRTAGGPYIDFKDTAAEDHDQRLQIVSGNFNFTASGLSIAGSEFIDSSRNIDIGSGTISSGVITADGLTVDTSTLVVDATNNRVGIGTTSPDTIMEIVGADPVLTLRDTSTSGALSHATLRLAETGASDDLNLHYDIELDETHLTFNFDNGSGTENERMRIDASGNLLVGTTDTTLYSANSGGGIFAIPNGSTTIARQSTNSTQPLLILNETGLDGTLQEFRKDGSIVGSIGTKSSGLYIGTDDAGIFFNHHGSGNLDAVIPYDIGQSSFYNGHVDLGATGGRFKDLYLSNGVDLNRVDGGTQVQVAMKQAGSLKTQLTSNFSDSKFYLYHQGGNRLVIENTGNVGIGTSTPDYTLDVEGPGRFLSDSTDSRVLYLKQHITNNGNIVQFVDQADTNVWELVGRNNQFYIYNNNVSTFSLYINPTNNNLGIGHNATNEKLDVNGSVKIGNVKIQDADSGRIGLNRNTADGTIYNSSYSAFQINGAYTNADFLDFQEYTSAGTYNGGMRLQDGKLAVGSGNSSFSGTPENAISIAHDGHGLGLDYVGATLPRTAGMYTSSTAHTQTGYGDLNIKARTDYGSYYGIGFFTASSNSTPVRRMAIYSNGNVTKPNQCYFFCRPPGGHSITANTDYTVTGTWTQDHDVGNNFGTNSFTAPIDGVYAFNFQIFINSAATRLDAFITVNGSQRARTEQQKLTNVSTNHSQMVHAILKLQANDSVTFGAFANATASTYTVNSPWSYASGYLLG